MGSTSLTVDFEVGTDAGSIIDRWEFAAPSITSTDIDLGPSAIGNGAFSGTETGGQGNDALVTTISNEQYSGLLVGPNDEELVGVLTLQHDKGGIARAEYGGFLSFCLRMASRAGMFSRGSEWTIFGKNT